MHLYLNNTSAADITIKGTVISPNQIFTIPTLSLTSWCSDLTLRVCLLNGTLQACDQDGNSFDKSDAQELMRAIIKLEVGTS